MSSVNEIVEDLCGNKGREFPERIENIISLIAFSLRSRSSDADILRWNSISEFDGDTYRRVGLIVGS